MYFLSFSRSLSICLFSSVVLFLCPRLPSFFLSFSLVLCHGRTRPGRPSASLLDQINGFKKRKVIIAVLLERWFFSASEGRFRKGRGIRSSKEKEKKTKYKSKRDKRKRKRDRKEGRTWRDRYEFACVPTRDAIYNYVPAHFRDRDDKDTVPSVRCRPRRSPSRNWSPIMYHNNVCMYT